MDIINNVRRQSGKLTGTLKRLFKLRVQWNRVDLANYQAEMDLLQHVPIESETVSDHPEQRVDAILEERRHCSVVQ